MPGRCSGFWREAPALPERLASYLEEVGQSIRWRRARPFALRELCTHRLEQRDCFLEEGMTEQEAEEAALREMGDAGTVGRELDAVHRPREQWFWLAAVVLLSCGVVFLRCYLTAGFLFEVPHPGKTFAALLLGLAAMAGMYALDYRILMRHAGKVYAAAILLGILTYHFGPHVNHAAWHTRHVVLLYPAVYGIWLNNCRNKGWEGFFLAIFGGLPLAIIACMAPYMLGLFLLLGTGLILVLMAAGADWFGIGKGKTVFSTLACAVSVLVPACYYGWGGWVFRRMRMMLYPENDPLGFGYQAISVRNMLSGAVWQGKAAVDPMYGTQTYEYIVPNWEGDFFLTTIACKLGWLFFLLAVGLMLALFGCLLACAFRERNPFGRLLATGALLPLLVQTVGATAQNLGYFVVSVSTPLFSGNLNTVLTMALLGLALSTLRQKDLSEEQVDAPRTRWKLVLVRE